MYKKININEPILLKIGEIADEHNIKIYVVGDMFVTIYSEILART